MSQLKNSAQIIINDKERSCIMDTARYFVVSASSNDICEYKTSGFEIDDLAEAFYQMMEIEDENMNSAVLSAVARHMAERPGIELQFLQHLQDIKDCDHND